MNKIGTQKIDTERCVLRRIVPNDYQMMYEKWANNYESNIYFHWVIEWKENTELIGTINLGNVDELCFMCDTSYMLSPKYWGKGIMTEVLQAVLNYAFNEIELNRVQATEEQKRLIILPEEFEPFHKKVENLQKIYPGRIEDSNIQNYKQIRNAIADYEDEELYSLGYGFVAVRPNGDLSFSCNMGNPYVFGKAYESMKIPVDEKLQEYIDVLRKAEMATLKKAREEIVEFDVTVDKFVAEMA